MAASSEETSKALVKQIIMAYTYVFLWISLSSCVILSNKYLLAYAGFPYPIALTLW